MPDCNTDRPAGASPHRDERVAALIAAMATAQDESALIDLAGRSRRLAFSLLSEGEPAARLTRAIADLNDALTRRLLDVVRARHALDGICFAWMALGSEGRQEQTVHTDQDNAIVFESAAPQADRPRLLAFADEVNRLLDRCGFALCRGDIMARNPRWCLTQDEWQDYFAGWIDTGDPKALLHGAIFFDFRALWGATALVQRLRTWLSAYIAPRPLFLRQMSENALANRPPLGWFGRLRVPGGGAHPGRFDIKINGTGLITDGARILALARGVGMTGTAQRLAAWAQDAHERREAESWTEAFHTLQEFRLRRQGECHARGEPLDNLVDPARLSGFDRRLLRACYAEAKALQLRLAMEYGLGV